jgi:hypothetical protein
MDVITEAIAPTWFVASLGRSEAQISAGQTVPPEPVLDYLRASIDRMRAEESPDEPPRAAGT